MVALIMLGAVLVLAAIVATIITQYAIQRLKAELSDLDQTKLEALWRLEDATRRSSSIRATYALFERMKAEKVHERAELVAALEEFEEQFGPEHEIGEGRSLDPDPLIHAAKQADQGPEEQLPEEQAPARRDIKVRQPLQRRPFDAD